VAEAAFSHLIAFSQLKLTAIDILSRSAYSKLPAIFYCSWLQPTEERLKNNRALAQTFAQEHFQ
jgi:hypothetical protein